MAYRRCSTDDNAQAMQQQREAHGISELPPGLPTYFLLITKVKKAHYESSLCTDMNDLQLTLVSGESKV